MASSTFRDSMNSLGWSRREADIPANTSTSRNPLLARISSLNPFGGQGYVQLPTHEAPGAPLPAPTRREEEEGWFACELVLRMTRITPNARERSGARLRTWANIYRSAVSRWDRLLIFGGCNLAALACFVICFALFPGEFSCRPATR
jgi:hypothetical protein